MLVSTQSLSSKHLNGDFHEMFKWRNQRMNDGNFYRFYGKILLHDE